MPQPHLSLLSDSDVEYLHHQILTVLETVGARFESAAARDILDNSGCNVDGETRVVRIPRELVEETISSLRRDVLLAGRDPQRDVALDGSRTFATTAGICPYIVARDTGEPREPTLADLSEIGRLVDALDELDLLWFAVSPTADAPGETTDLASLACLLAASGKHIMGQLVRPQDVPVALEMLRLAAPGNDLGRRPIFSSIYCPVAPLVHEGDASEAGMEMARAGIPIDIFSLALAGATSPITLAGTVVQTLADELSAAVLFKQVAPDCSLILSANSGIMDMATSRFATSTPETLLMSMAEIEMVRSYGAPSLSVGHVPDSYELGFRAGLEDMAQAIVTRLAAPDIMIGLGTVEAGQAISLAKLVVDAEVVQHNNRLLRGMRLDEEHMATGLIAAVGPGGNYLGQKQTRRQLRSGEHWMPRLLQRRSGEEWQRLTHPVGEAAGAASDASAAPSPRGELSLAEARVQDILEKHEPMPLPDGVAGRLEEMARGIAGERR